MQNKKIVYVLLLLSFVLVFVSPVFAAAEEPEFERVYSLLDDKVLAKPVKPSATSVSIRNLASGDTVYSQVLIIAQASGSFEQVVYQVDRGSDVVMVRVSGDRYEATWDTADLLVGIPHTLTVLAKAGDSVVASTSVSVTVASGFLWEVDYEIDYMAGHEPSTAVLEYMQSYWEGRAIKVTYLPGDLVDDPTSGDGYISDEDFWEIENEYNDGADNSMNGLVYDSKEKWMLYGTYDASYNVGGYTYVGFIGKDLAAGNYIFIADGMIDSWESAYGIPSDGGEAIVTCHEAGHSVGIAVLRGLSEKYDSDFYSIMSYMRLQNAKDMAGYWYYSKEYWATANLSYYLYS